MQAHFLRPFIYKELVYLVLCLEFDFQIDIQTIIIQGAVPMFALVPINIVGWKASMGDVPDPLPVTKKEQMQESGRPGYKR